MDNHVKRTMCVITYQEDIISKYGNVFKGVRNRECIFYNTKEGCLGAHNKNEIKLNDNIKNFNNMDYSKLDLLHYYNVMKNLILNNKKNLESKHKKIIDVTNLSDFINVLYLWYDLAYYYGKYSKNYYDIKDKIKYKTKNSIPNFKFDNEDLMWVLYKKIKKCDNHWNLIDCIRSKKKFPVKKLCTGDINCKFGYHITGNSICIDDLINGKCNCEYNNIKNDIIKLKKNIRKLENKLKEENSKNTGEELLILNEKLKKYESINHNTKKHLTNYGLICFSDRVKQFNENLNKKLDLNSGKKVAKVLKVKK